MGPTGPAGISLFANVEGNGTLLQGTAVSATRTAAGDYTVTFGQQIDSLGNPTGKAAAAQFKKDRINDLHPAISELRARQIAQRLVPNAPVTKIDLKGEHGTLLWDIDLATPGPGHEEVLIDANTGTVLQQSHQEDVVDKLKKPPQR